MTCEERVRQLLVQHETLDISDLVTKSGFPEAEVRAVLATMQRTGEGGLARDIVRGADYFTRSLVGTGKLVVERRLEEMAGPDRLGVKIERVTWSADRKDGEAAWRITVATPGREASEVFTESELEEIADNEDNRSVTDSQLFRLLSARGPRRLR